MASRFGFVVAVAVLGCTMDNPAFGPERDVGADESGDGDPTGLDESSESNSSTTLTTHTGDGDGDASTTNGDGDGDASTTNGDGDGDSSTTNGDGDGDEACPANTPCGACHVCNDIGDCVPDVGAPCAGPETNCSEYLWGPEAGTCYKLPDVVVGSHCDMSGQCKINGPQNCPLQQGAALFECDPGCVTNPQGCSQFALAANVDMAAMCAVAGPGPDCHDVCFNVESSSVTHYECQLGVCVDLMSVDLCWNYACDEEGAFCYEQCNDIMPCAQGFTCSQTFCI